MAKYNFQDIPYELQKLRQWVLWSYEERPDKKNGGMKLTKVPKQVDGNNASPTYKGTWSSFSAAKHVMQEYGFNGIGFVFTAEDDFIGVDIDACVDDKGNISEFAKKVIDALDSYTEFSPSGKGVHIIIQGALPEGFKKGMRNDELGIEIYSEGRYFTFTGDKENGNNVVIERTEELAELVEELFDFEEAADDVDFEVDKDAEYDENSLTGIWNKMFKSKSGEDIKRMFNGELVVNNDHSSTDQSLCNHLAFWCDKNYSLMDHMFRQSDLMRDKWDEKRGSETYGEITLKKAISGTKETLNPSTERLIKIKEADAAPQNFTYTELGNAEWFAHEYKEKVLHSKQYGWLIWNGKKWEIDETNKVELYATKLFKTLLAFHSDHEDEEVAEAEEKAAHKWGHASQSRRVITNSQLLSIALMPVRSDELDTNKYLLNCQNGIIDLKAGVLLPHESHHLMTKIADVGYEKDAETPTWTKFLETILVDESGKTNHELIRYVQKLIGYSMTGDITDQSMYFLYGGGKNGKSTFINTIKDILGDYARQTNKETFIFKENNGGANSDVARLAGSRFVSAIESNEGEKLDESIIKQITGGEAVIARFMHKDYFEFSPEFKVFFTTNHKPIVKGTDEGIWRRIKLVPFLAFIPEEDRDAKLPVKLKEEASGILNWMVEGCLLWQKEGLTPPKQILNSGEEYRNEMDLLLPFILENCNINPLSEVGLKELYTEYKYFCQESGDYELKKRTFTRELDTRHQLMIKLTVAGGLRRGELLGIAYDCVDFAKNQIFIKRSLQYTKKEGFRLKETKTGESRIITFPSTVMDELRIYYKKQLLQRTNNEREWEGFVDVRGREVMLFVCDATGHPYNPQAVTRFWGRFMRRNQDMIKRIRFQDLRHSSASLILSDGINMKVLQKRLGHKDIKTSLNIYSHVTNKDDQKASDVFNDLV